MTVQDLRKVALIGTVAFVAVGVWAVTERVISGEWFAVAVFGFLTLSWFRTAVQVWQFGRSNGKGVEAATDATETKPEPLRQQLVERPATGWRKR